GDLPLIGKLFQDANVSHSRNELIVTVTPHLVRQTGADPQTVASAVPLPSPQPWPTLGPQPATQPLPTVPIPAPLPTTPAIARAVSTPVPSLAPSPEPSAFAQTNVYTFGAAPQNNYAAPQAQPQIFYVQVQPTVVGQGQQMTITAITTTNVSALSFGYGSMIPQATLTAVAPGKWQGTFSFSTAGLPVGQSNVQMTLSASTGMGSRASVPIPISVVQQ
ncbi:MAG: hypothetical protein ACREMP_10125, partial [Candidatus Tyrphobacter sp.]